MAPFLKMGTTCASFQISGSLALSMLFLNKRKRGVVKGVASFLRRKGEKPSGPFENLESRLFRAAKTSTLLKSMKLMVEVEGVKCCVGIPLSTVNKVDYDRALFQ